MEDDIVLKLEHCVEIQDAIRRNKVTPGHLKKITSGDFLAHVRQVVDGYAEIKPIERLIDCDADPYLPSDRSVEEHRKGGQWKWNPAKVKLWLVKEQQKGAVEGNKLREELKNKPVLNANVLDYLLKNPHLIPEEWKSKFVFFWGTIYRGRGGDLYVRYLYWRGAWWDWHYRWLGDVWGTGCPAALRAS